MAQKNYPYLDLTVLPELRPHVISSCAVVLFDSGEESGGGLDHILWANGEGANLLGSSAVRELLEGELSPNAVMKRQIQTAVEKLSNADEASAVMRVRSALKTRLLGFSVRNIQLPNGHTVVMLMTENIHGRGHSKLDMARSAVDCLDGYSHASAVLGPEGELLAASKHFNSLEVADAELGKLATEVATEDDRLVKRLIPTAKGDLAAGIARLSDDPTSHILIIAETSDQTSSSPEPLEKEHEYTGNVPQAAQQGGDGGGEESETDAETDDGPSVGAFSNKRKSAQGGLARWYFKQPRNEETTSPEKDTPVDTSVDNVRQDTESAPEESEPTSSLTDNASESGVLIQETSYTDGAAERPEGQEEAPDNTVSESDDEPSAANEEDLQVDDAAKPVRFVWDMDTDNRFREVSEELELSVGSTSADVVGATWEELVKRHNIDNGDEITALLRKGDTWSGKTVLWPVEGTDLLVPIDLAGLPSYGRNRVFDGFNGFGVVRMADAVVDPRAAGLKMSPVSQEATTNKDEAAPGSGEEVGEDASSALAANVVDLESLRKSKTDRTLSTDEQETFEEIGEKLSDDASSEDRSGDKATSETQENDGGADADFVPSAFAGPGRSVDDSSATIDPLPKARTPEHNVDTSILARLPIPVLVYRANDLFFGNGHFFDLTGYEDLKELAAAGGIETLFGANAETDDNVQSKIYHANGKQLDVQANLQQVPWDEDRAMLLTLRQGDSNDDSDDSGESGRGNQVEPGSPAGKSSQAGSTPETTSSKGPASRLAAVVPLNRNSDSSNDPLRAEFGGLEAEDLRNILDTATDGVVILSDEGIVRAMNKSAEALFDVGPDEALDQSFTGLLAPESHRLAMDYLSGMSGTGVASLMNDGREVIGKTAKGGLIPLFMTIGKLQKTDACCAVMRDITQWKKAEEELLSAKSIAESASAQKTEFLAKISHEIRTPLNAIIGFSDMMIEERFGKIDNDRYRGYLRDIHRSGSHVLELVNDLLDISKIEAGKMDLDFDACDLNTTVSETVALTQPEANKERIIIRTSLSAVVPKIVADSRSLRQIILNLVSNSIKFTKSGGQVIISTVYEESGEVVLRVRDTGVGMSELELARALKPFQQINAESNSQGTGLGLPLTKAMVEANRARFEIDSTPDEGTLVEIYFPSQRVLADR
ncbi:MAG: ATP-binding protein [Rhizobiaceae bacterium]